MSHRIPDDAFAYYVALGADRSYQRVADHFGVSKRGIINVAERERWKERLAAIEESARTRLDERLSETLEEMHARHLKMLRAMAARAAKAIQEYPLASGMDGFRAAEAVIKLERLVAGEASDRTQLTVEQITKQEIDRLLVKADDPPEHASANEEKGGSHDRATDGDAEDW